MTDAPPSAPPAAPTGRPVPVSAPQLADLPTDLANDRAALATPRRVSPIGPLFMAWAVVRQIGILNIGIFVAFVAQPSFQLIGLGASVLVLILGTLRWWRFKFWLDGDELVAEQGVLALKRTTVPLERIQAVSTRQNLLHRVLNLVEAKVDTAGSVGAEIELSAVNRSVADRIRRLSTATRTSAGLDTAIDEGAVETEELVLQRSTMDIVVFALTRNPLLLLAPLAFVFAIGAEVELVQDWVLRRGEAVADTATSTVAVAIAIVLLIIASAAVLVTAQILQLYRMRLVDVGRGLRLTRGLLSRRDKTVSYERVQMIDARQNAAERVLRLANVRMPVASMAASVGANGGPFGGLPNIVQLPGTRPAELDVLVDLLVPGEDFEALPERRISPLAIQRWTLWLGIVPAGIVTLIALPIFGLVALVAVAWIPVLAGLATRRQRMWRWELTPEALHIRTGLLGQDRRIVPVRKAQTVAVHQGWFHRRRGLADVRVTTAGRNALAVPFIPLAEAHAVRDELLHRVQTDPRPFM